MDEERINKLKQLLEETFEDANTYFNLNNYFFPQLQEYAKSCERCRTRVINRLKKFMPIAEYELDSLLNNLNTTNNNENL